MFLSSFLSVTVQLGGGHGMMAAARQGVLLNQMLILLNPSPVPENQYRLGVTQTVSTARLTSLGSRLPPATRYCPHTPDTPPFLAHLPLSLGKH